MMNRTATRDLATRQHSTLARRQLDELGFTSVDIARAVREGFLVRCSHSTFRIGGAAVTDDVRCIAAVLGAGPGGALSHASALALWGLPGFDLEHVEVVRPHGSGLTTVAGVRVHVSRCLPSSHVTALRDIPVVTPARALCDLAGRIRPERLGRLVDLAWSRQLLNGPVLHRTCAELARRGRRGGPAMRALLADRPVDHVPCESGLEYRLAALLRDDGQPPMRRQVDVGDDGHWIGRVDFVDDDAQVIVEVQSIAHHGTAEQRRRDAVRRRRLEAAGWVVIEAEEFELWFEPRRLVQRIRAARLRPTRARRAA
jgi:very-short-patch-repair endonuclease